MHSKVVDATQHKVNDVAQWTKTHASQAKEMALEYSSLMTEQARKTSREATAKLQELVRYTGHDVMYI